MGLGSKHPYTVHEILRIKDILSHTYQRSTAGNHYRTSLELLLLEIGTGHDLQRIPQEAIHLLSTETLVKSTYQFLLTHHLELQHDIGIKLLRKFEQALMSAFYDLHPSQEELLSLNKCIMYLQVYFLSDICTGDGLAISADAWSGKKLETSYKSMSWPC
jgi:hypothetical protein